MSTSVISYSNDEKYYFSKVFEKDHGQPTENPHMEARRHITSSMPTTREVVHSIQNNSNKIKNHKLDIPTIEKLNSIINIKPFFDIELKDSSRESRDIISSYMGPYKNLPLHRRKAGIYI